MWAALAVLQAGCRSYGGPPAHPEPPAVATPSCVVGIVMADQHHAVLGMDTQATAAELIATLRATGWFRAVDHLEDLAEPADLRLRVRVRSGLLNEPYLAVITIGLVPNPIVDSHGYELAMLDEQGAVMKRIDTLYWSHGYWGWFAPLLMLLPNQFSAPPTDRYARYVASLLVVEAPELLKPCG